jgi:hypothetical protein
LFLVVVAIGMVAFFFFFVFFFFFFFVGGVFSPYGLSQV